MSNTLSESATKLLKLIEERHEGMHFISAQGREDGQAFVQVMIPVEELNKIAEGMAVLASLVVLNPAHAIQLMQEKKHG